MTDGLIDDFLDMQAAEHGAAQNTIDAYRRDLELLSAFVGKDLTLVGERDVQKFVQALSEKGAAPTSISRRISALNDFFKFLLSEKEITDNPMVNISAPKKGRRLPKFLTRDEVNLMLTAAEHNPDIRHKRTAAMLKLMYACGLRVSELVGLPLNCINYDRQQILIKGKGAKERIVPIAKAAIDDVLAYLPERRKLLKDRETPFLFPSATARSGHITRDGFFKNLKNLAVLAGIDVQKVSPHVFRHSFATHLINREVDLRSLQKMLGHENISTTEIYTHILSDELRDDVQKRHPLAQRQS